ncbi:hypothetical protein B0T21DRAFT_382162 [Apiosordaria backusii]|uniref:Uncharacterized protein n=1 Tax=Apiosordaria backusii TaxID=314023 RepID=A0AA40BRN3_9PEZI|nr:hypothetical protein B0T21DRAFT_382162 [Apiosordaria backusii]
MRVVNRAASQRSKPSLARLSFFPLQDVSTADLQGLSTALWDWDICDGCTKARECQKPDSCPWSQRSDRLQPFFDYYRRKTRSYVPEVFQENGKGMALSCHQDLAKLISYIRTFGPHTTTTTTTEKSSSFHRRFFEDPAVLSTGANVPRADQDQAIDLALAIMTMTTTCLSVSVDHHTPHGHDDDDDDDDGYQHSVAASDPYEILNQKFPRRIHPSLQDSDRQSDIIKKGLQGHNLVRKGGLKLQTTYDLREHLRVDEDTGVVKIFCWSSVGRVDHEDLDAAEEEEEEVYPRPPIPRGLALETLHTLHLLLPPSSPKSQSLLRNLVSKSGFDPDILRFKTSGLSAFELGPEERDKALKFGIWGSRLMDLYDEIENPKPRSRVDVWLERRSKSRHVMMATIAGVGAAVVLGVLGLAVGIFQAWISWQQWKLESGKAGKE